MPERVLEHVPRTIVAIDLPELPSRVILLQDLQTERVPRADARLADSHLREPLVHLITSAPTKRHREDRLLRDPTIGQADDTVNESSRLTGPRLRHQYARPLTVFDREALFGIHLPSALGSVE